MAFGGDFTGQIYTESTGKDLYRRSMYTIWKRTVPPPALVTFDAPDREKCTARRSITNTPLQALVLLNDPTYVEATRFLAARMITQAGHDPGKRIDFAFRLATGRNRARRSAPFCSSRRSEALADYRQRRSDGDEGLWGRCIAKRIPGWIQELAAWTTVAGIILNLDETITERQ